MPLVEHSTSATQHVTSEGVLDFEVSDGPVDYLPSDRSRWSEEVERQEREVQHSLPYSLIPF